MTTAAGLPVLQRVRGRTHPTTLIRNKFIRVSYEGGRGEAPCFCRLIAAIVGPQGFCSARFAAFSSLMSQGVRGAGSTQINPRRYNKK